MDKGEKEVLMKRVSTNCVHVFRRLLHVQDYVSKDLPFATACCRCVEEAVLPLRLCEEQRRADGDYVDETGIWQVVRAYPTRHVTLV